MKNPGTHIVIIFLGACVLIGYVFQFAPTAAPIGVPAIIAFAGGIITLLSKQNVTDAKVDAATAQSAENAQSIAAVSVQTSHGLEGVNQKVDGHLGGLMQRIELLEQKNASLEQATALKVSTDAQAAALKQQADEQATANKDEIIAAGNANVAAAAALAPPDHAPAGSTPAHGTTIAPGGPTTIVIDPGTPVTVVPPTEPQS